MRNLFVALLIGFILASEASSAVLPDPVRDALRRANIPLSSVGVVVHKAGARNPLITYNSDRAMNPASTMKLLTTYAALETLGPAYRWKTEAYLDGRLESGILHGNLVFKGYGDPKLTIEQFWLWLRELRQRGLREIRGDIVLDCSFFEAGIYDPAGFDSDPQRAYNVGPNPLLLNFNALRLRLIPNDIQPDALLEPNLSGYALENRIKASATQPCRGGDSYRAKLEEQSIVLEGSMPVGCGEVEDYFSLLPHSDYFFAVFSSLWAELGGSLHGKVQTGSVPVNLVPFSTHYSPPLSEVIRDINKFSNNVMARHLFLTLGTLSADGQPTFSQMVGSGSRPAMTAANPQQAVLKGDGGPESVAPDLEPAVFETGFASTDDSSGQRCDPLASIARSTTAMQRWLDANRLRFPELILENGSGLSRKERISPMSLAELLQHASRSRFSAEMVASLPILGMDGTLRKRVKNNAGYGHLKTGMLDGVKSLAGYVQTRSGDQWVVVFIINHPNARYGQAAQDALIEWLQASR